MKYLRRMDIRFMTEMSDVLKNAMREMPKRARVKNANKKKSAGAESDED